MLVGDGLQACCREQVVPAIWWVKPQSLVNRWNWRERSGNDGMRVVGMIGAVLGSFFLDANGVCFFQQRSDQFFEPSVLFWYRQSAEAVDGMTGVTVILQHWCTALKAAGLLSCLQMKITCSE